MHRQYHNHEKLPNLIGLLNEGLIGYLCFCTV